MELTHDDVQQILRLVGDNEIDYLEVQVGDTRLVADRHGTVHRQPPPTPQPLSTPQPPPTHQPAPVALVPEKVDAAPPTRVVSKAAEDVAGLVQITAPVLGVFYAAPEPGAPPYVEVGTQVSEDSTVGLIEVMKMFNGVQAGVRGEVVRILVGNEDFVEHGQPLFDIRPTE